jgi:hypothetical protein
LGLYTGFLRAGDATKEILRVKLDGALGFTGLNYDS